MAVPSALSLILPVCLFIATIITSRISAKMTEAGLLYRDSCGDIMLINKLELHQGRVKDPRPHERFVAWIHPDAAERWERLDLKIGLLECFKQCSCNHCNLLRLDSESFATFIKMCAVCTMPSSLIAKERMSKSWCRRRGLRS